MNIRTPHPNSAAADAMRERATSNLVTALAAARAFAAQVRPDMHVDVKRKAEPRTRIALAKILTRPLMRTTEVNE